MIVILSSTNPQLSYLIGKNPSGIPIVRPLRSGFLFGWFDENDSQKYVVYFHDDPDTCSFQSIEGVNDAKYVNVGQYSSSLILSSIINDLFSSAVKKHDSRDTLHQHQIYISGFRIKNIKLFQSIRDSFPDIKFDYKHLVGFMYELTLIADGALFDFIKVISLLTILTSLGNKESITLDGGAIEKYYHHINQVTTGKIINDGWYLRYLFKKRARVPKNQLHLLETPRLKLTYGNTSDARTDFIVDNVKDCKVDFLDIGCGTDLLIKRMIQKKCDSNYYLIDADLKVQEKLQSRGLVCYSSIEKFYEAHPDFNGNVIMTEVIEHNEEIQAAIMVDMVLSHKPQQMFITTPNFDFNKFFDREGFRHDDHHWEMTWKQFQTWITDIVKEYPYDVVFMGVGDSIDEIPITSGVILTRR